MSLLRLTNLNRLCGHRSGNGTTGKLLCPSLSTARTAKITLSFEMGNVVLATFPTACVCSHSALVVARHSTSYVLARPPGEGSQVSVESFSSSLVTRRTLAGAAGPDASDARVAAFRRATLAI